MFFKSRYVLVKIGDRNPLPQKKCKNRGSESPPTEEEEKNATYAFKVR